MLPLENARGRDLVESGKLCERKNGRGVDPNRNWPVDWGKKEKDYDPNEEFPGAGPFRWLGSLLPVWAVEEYPCIRGLYYVFMLFFCILY